MPPAKIAVYSPLISGSKNRAEDLPMSSKEIVIDVRNLSKRYEIYNTPRDRLKQLVLPRLCQTANRAGVTGFTGFTGFRIVILSLRNV